MVAIKGVYVSALPLLLAAANTVAASYIDADDLDLVARSDLLNNDDLDYLEARDAAFDYYSALETRGKDKKPKIDKSKIGKPTDVKGTHPVTIPDKDLKSSKNRASSLSSSSGYIPIALDKNIKKGKRSLRVRGKDKKIDKSKIGKPTNVKGTHPVTIPDKDLKSSKNRPISSSSGYIPIALDPKLKKGKRSLRTRGKDKKIDKSKIGKPTNVKGTHPVTIPDKDLKSSKNRPISSSSGYIPIALDPKLKKGKRSLRARGSDSSKISKSKIGKPTNVKGTHPVTIPDKDLKSSKNRPISSSSGYIPIALDPKLKKGKRSLRARGSDSSKISKSKIGKPTNVKGTHPVTIPDKDLKSSKNRPISSSSGYIPIALDPKLKKGKRSLI